MDRLNHFKRIVKARTQLLAEVISLETGKPLWESTQEVQALGTKVDLTFEAARDTTVEEINDAIRAGRISSPVVLGRDHHDVSGTDSPYRETANIRDGSSLCADMAVHNVIGDAFRGATWVSLHNGGGVGWGEVINGGFGMLLDGTADADEPPDASGAHSGVGRTKRSHRRR